MTKEYDREYFDHWYRRERISTATEVRRKAALAVGTAEYFLRRTARSALDIGSGEGAWRAALLSMRPRLRYRGIDPSEYATIRFGKTRNLTRGSFSDVARIRGAFDIVICADVLHYLSDEEILAGLGAVVARMNGVLFLELLTTEDDIVGDLQDLKRRPAKWYRKVFRKAGLRQVGPYLWISDALIEGASELEIADQPPKPAVPFE